MVRRALEAKIKFDYPKASERQFSQPFSSYLSFLVEKIMILMNYKTVCGLPFSGVFTESMIDRAVEYSYTPKQIIFTRDLRNIWQIRGDLKYRISGLIAEIINRHGTALTDFQILELFENEMHSLNHFELLFKYENPRLKITLRNYLFYLINFIRALVSTSTGHIRRVPIYTLTSRIVIGDREGYAIYRYLLRNYPTFIQ